jgi:HEPN domain-containing protein
MPELELIQAWLIKAKHDLDTAKLVSVNLPEYGDTIAFHCQQAIEKTLKAYLIFLEMEFKQVHDLGYLLNLIITHDEAMETYYPEVDEISRYAVQIRYPDEIIRLSDRQIQDAIQLADQLYSLIENKIKRE